MTSVRYMHFPFMQNYDNMEGGNYVPYAMLSGPVDFHDPIINTDKFGFRYTESNGKVFKVENLDEYDQVNLIIGGSTVFGVGASGDFKTVPSYLSKESNEIWLNLGLRGGVSIQEYIHLIRFLHKAKKINNIVFLSGNNDLYINLASEINDGFDRRFGEVGSQDVFYSCKRRVLVSLVSSINGVDKKYLLNKRFKELLISLVKRPQVEEIKLSTEDKLRNLFENYQRNFLLYAALQKQLNCKVSFVLQPFFNWTGKTATDIEKKVFEELEMLQKDSAWSFYKKQMNESVYNRYSNMLRELASANHITFYDSNPDFNLNETLFVDAVHLNDEGNKLMSKVILDRVLQK